MKRFGGFREEPEQEARRADVRETAEMKILKAWHQVNAGDWKAHSYHPQETISLALAGIRASQTDVDTFLSHLKSLAETPVKEFDLVAGIFLSTLVNEGSEDAYTLNLSGLPGITGLGADNCKRLTIIGSVRECGLNNSSEIRVIGDATIVGYEQDSGSIEIFGNCSDAGSRMSGGHIIIHGTSKMLGRQMSGGRIDAFGKVKSLVKVFKIRGSFRRMGHGQVGNGMSGGEIHMHHDRVSALYLNPEGGRIFVKEKLVFDEGKLVSWRFRAEKWLQEMVDRRPTG